MAPGRPPPMAEERRMPRARPQRTKALSCEAPFSDDVERGVARIDGFDAAQIRDAVARIARDRQEIGDKADEGSHHGGTVGDAGRVYRSLVAAQSSRGDATRRVADLYAHPRGRATALPSRFGKPPSQKRNRFGCR